MANKTGTKNRMTDAVDFATLTLLTAIFIFIFPVSARSDIYSFVTIDGVETFTDAPVNKQARIVIKETSRQKAKNTSKKTKPEKIHTISLDEIIEKTIRSAHNSENGNGNEFLEPRLPPVGGRITSGVGLRVDPIDGKLRHHNGIDIAISEGTPVFPAAAGIVVYSGLRSGYGYTLLIEHNNGMVTLYGHNSSLLVTAGQYVDKDMTIALSGNTGRSTGPHLHFEAWQSGINVTAAFMPGSTMKISGTQIASYKSKPAFRREILADGSILFTNTH